MNLKFAGDEFCLYDLKAVMVADVVNATRLFS